MLLIGMIVVAEPGTGAARPSASGQVQFRSGIEIAQIDVVAVDAHGNAVKDLSREEFVLMEDGAVRPVASLSLVDVPLRSAGPPLPADVTTNVGVVDARVFFLVLDDVNSTRSSTQPIVDAARRLIGELAPNDRIGVLWVSLADQGAWEFTTDHAGVLASLEKFAAEGASVQRVVGRAPPRQSLDDDTPSSPDRSPDVKGFFDGLRPYAIIRDVSNQLAPVKQRRKSIVYIGEGVRGAGAGGEQVQIDRRSALAAAQRANVTLYLLDPRTATRRPHTPGFRPPSFSDIDRLRAGDPLALAQATGGFGFSSLPIPDQIGLIIKEASTYYLLGFEPAPHRSRFLDRARQLMNPWSGFRRIEVRTTRPGVRVVTRAGYWPSPSSSVDDESTGSEEAVRAAIASVLPDPQVPLSAFVAVFPGNREKHLVALAVELGYGANDGAMRSGYGDDIVLAVVAYEHRGRAVRRSDTLRMRVSSASDRSSGPRRYVLCHSLDLPPGRYHLRIAVHSGILRKAGSVHYDLVVPDVRAAPVALSTILLGTQATPTFAANGGVFLQRVGLIPTTTRVITAATPMTAVVRAVHPAANGRPSIQASIVAIGANREVWRETRSFELPHRPEDAFSFRLPTGQLQPGPHRLVVTLRGARGETVSQSAHFQVSP